MKVLRSTITICVCATFIFLITGSATAQTRPDLKEAAYFGVLAEQDVQTTDKVLVSKAAGSNQTVSADITARGGIFADTACITQTALQAVRDARAKIRQESGIGITPNVGGQTFTAGVYEVNQNMAVNGDMRLQGGAEDCVYLQSRERLYRKQWGQDCFGWRKARKCFFQCRGRHPPAKRSRD